MFSYFLILCLFQVMYAFQRKYKRIGQSPYKACESLNPTIVAPAQNRVFPYDIIIDPKEPYIGEKIKVTIKGKHPKDKIGGFMVQAREDFNSPFGQFQQCDHEKDVKTINCKSPRTTAMHVKYNEREHITLTWTPPNLYKGPAVFFITVIKSRKVLWVAQKTEPVWYMKEQPPPFQIDQF